MDARDECETRRLKGDPPATLVNLRGKPRVLQLAGGLVVMLRKVLHRGRLFVEISGTKVEGFGSGKGKE